ncbi:MAG: hypothetical protein ACKO3G_08605 [Planctomycetaceae bacterium]
MAEMLGETADEALAPGSRFARVLANVTPETTVTLWCHPDSFETFRRMPSTQAVKGTTTETLNRGVSEQRLAAMGEAEASESRQ